MYKLLSILVFLLFPIFAKAADISSCTLKPKPDEMNYCKASYAGSATFCDMIKNGELKRDCYFLVIRVQRNNAYQIKKAEPEAAVKEQTLVTLKSTGFGVFQPRRMKPLNSFDF